MKWIKQLLIQFVESMFLVVDFAWQTYGHLSLQTHGVPDEQSYKVRWEIWADA